MALGSYNGIASFMGLINLLFQFVSMGGEKNGILNNLNQDNPVSRMPNATAGTSLRVKWGQTKLCNTQ
jgi:hypothetical protein